MFQRQCCQIIRVCTFPTSTVNGVFQGFSRMLTGFWMSVSHPQVCFVQATMTFSSTSTWAATPRLASWWTTSTLFPWQAKPRASPCFQMRRRNTAYQALASALPWGPECTSHPRVLSVGADRCIVITETTVQDQETVSSTALNSPWKYWKWKPSRC